LSRIGRQTFSIPFERRRGLSPKLPGCDCAAFNELTLGRGVGSNSALAGASACASASLTIAASGALPAGRPGRREVVFGRTQGALPSLTEAPQSRFPPDRGEARILCQLE